MCQVACDVPFLFYNRCLIGGDCLEKFEYANDQVFLKVEMQLIFQFQFAIYRRRKKEKPQPTNF